MNARVKKLWAEALRSGKYKQAKKRLRLDHAGSVRMCCLGVLCEVFRQTEKRGRWVHGKRGWQFFVDGEKATTLTPDTVWKWAELPDANPNLDDNRHYASALNDDGKDFNYIADRIEKYL